MAFSAGFHPHPRISYANAAATGAASEAEYVEIALIRRVDPQGVRAALNAALPDGLDILDVVEAGPGSLADRLEASVWELTFAAAESARLRAACEVFRAAESCEVSRMTKSGLRVFDARAAVLAMEVREALSDGCVILRLVVRHTTPAVRPDDVLNALDRCATFVPAARPLVTRLAQGPLVGTTGVADPLVSDGNVTGP